MVELGRYILVATVAQTHLWPLGAEWIGPITVFVLYALSGYLITRVLNTRYSFGWMGTSRFIGNRILRP